jgi:hypothetical protein
MLPLELGDPDLFGEDLQLVLSCVVFFLESAGNAVRIARVPTRRPGRVRAARRPRGVTHHGRSCSWSRGRVPLDEPENAKKIVGDEIRSKRRLWRSRRSPPLASVGTAPFGLVVGRTPVAAFCHGVLGVLVLKRKSLG